MLGVRDREKVSLQLWLEGRQSWSMSHREREIVPDRGTSERKGMLSLKFLASVWNTKYAIISRAAESVLQSVTRCTLLIIYLALLPSSADAQCAEPPWSCPILSGRRWWCWCPVVPWLPAHVGNFAGSALWGFGPLGLPLFPAGSFLSLRTARIKSDLLK